VGELVDLKFVRQLLVGASVQNVHPDLEIPTHQVPHYVSVHLRVRLKDQDQCPHERVRVMDLRARSDRKLAKVMSDPFRDQNL
jgi:hypothetical protein